MNCNNVYQEIKRKFEQNTLDSHRDSNDSKSIVLIESNHELSISSSRNQKVEGKTIGEKNFK
jgi:hypothetical protein